MSTVKSTKRQAASVLTEMVRHFGKAHGEPTLYPPGFHHGTWVIAWEAGPQDWTIKVLDVIEPSDDVWIEPVNHWSVAIWREV